MSQEAERTKRLELAAEMGMKALMLLTERERLFIEKYQRGFDSLMDAGQYDGAIKYLESQMAGLRALRDSNTKVFLAVVGHVNSACLNVGQPALIGSVNRMLEGLMDGHNAITII